MKRAYAIAAASTTALLFVASNAHAQRKNPAAPHSDVKPTKAATVEMTMVQGDNRSVSTEDVQSYSVAGGQGIVDVKLAPAGDKFVFVGVRPGRTTVLMLKKNGAEVTYDITVFAHDPGPLEKELQELLTGYTGLRIRRVGTRFFIEGGVSTEGDVKRINAIADLYGEQVKSLVVQGSVGVEHTINVRIDFYFVQYDKSSSYGVGVSWPSRFGGGTGVGAYDLVGGNATATLSRRAARRRPSRTAASRTSPSRTASRAPSKRSSSGPTSPCSRASIARRTSSK
jgi:pilus assembly protein CpaC